MRNFYQDLRFGLRLLRGSPGFTAVAILTLAIGIAASTTVFSWIDAILLRPIPGAAAPHALAVIETTTANGEYIKSSYPDYRDYRDNMRTISGVAAVFGSALRLGEGEGGRETWGELVTWNYFDVLGVKPHMGRFFRQEEAGDPPAARPVAVVSHDLWKGHFQSDPGILGRVIYVNRRPLTVIGVAAPNFHGSMAGVAHSLWVPLPLIQHLNRANDIFLTNRWTRALELVARLKPGVSFEQANAEAQSSARQMAAANPLPNQGIGVGVFPITDTHLTGAQPLLRQPLQILMAICAVVLLIVCANVANLLLARATARQKEFAIRLALGASRLRLARQLLTETFVVAAVGAVIGMLLTPWLGGALILLMPPISIPVYVESGMNLRVLGFTTLTCVAAVLLSGLAPLVCSLRPDVNETLKEGGRGERSGARSHRLRGLLVVTEVALASMALIGAGLFAKSFRAARNINPGFSTENVLVTRFSLADTGLTVERQHEFALRLRQRLEGAPGITEVAYADVAPLGFDTGPWQDIQVEGYTPAQGENMKLYRSLVAPGYFDLLRIAMLAGRDFTDADTKESARVAIVNQAFAWRFFGDANPIGRKVRCWGQWATVVGVVRNARYHNVAGPAEPYFYVPYTQVFTTGLHTLVYVRTKGDPAGATSLVRREAAMLNPDATMMESMPLGEYIEAAVYPLKVAATMLSVLGALAVLLAALGLYSVMAYAVSQRTREMGIRMAMGASSGDVLRMVVRQALAMTGVGLVAGLIAAVAGARLISSLLVNVGATDPATFAGAAALLAAVSVLASYLPARRATKVDPMTALRCE